jgi:deoxycytidylate deaminase
VKDLPRYFKLARSVSLHSEHKYRLGAVLVIGGAVVSVGFNKCKYNAEYSYPDRNSIHAEAQCIKTSGKYDLRGSIMFIYREDKFGNVSNAHPCEYCMELLRSEGIKKIWFTTDEFPNFGVERV